MSEDERYVEFGEQYINHILDVLTDDVSKIHYLDVDLREDESSFKFKHDYLGPTTRTKGKIDSIILDDLSADSPKIRLSFKDQDFQIKAIQHLCGYLPLPFGFYKGIMNIKLSDLNIAELLDEKAGGALIREWAPLRDIEMGNDCLRFQFAEDAI